MVYSWCCSLYYGVFMVLFIVLCISLLWFSMPNMLHNTHMVQRTMLNMLHTHTSPLPCPLAPHSNQAHCGQSSQ